MTTLATTSAEQANPTKRACGLYTTIKEEETNVTDTLIVSGASQRLAKRLEYMDIVEHFALIELEMAKGYIAKATCLNTY